IGIEANVNAVVAFRDAHVDVPPEAQIESELPGDFEIVLDPGGVVEPLKGGRVDRRDRPRGRIAKQNGCRGYTRQNVLDQVVGAGESASETVSPRRRSKLNE